MTPEQCRAARALVGWSRDRLAEWARVSKATIATFEVGKHGPQERTLAALQRTLEKAGVEFIAEDRGKGVLLRARRGRRVAPRSAP